MKKKRILAVLLAAAVILSLASFGLAATDNQASANQLTGSHLTLGNVPAEYIPNSEITFTSDETFEVTNVITSVPAPSRGLEKTGVEIGGNLAEQYPEVFRAKQEEAQRILESLPVYTYEEYYVAGKGATALYDQVGQLIRVRGDYEYHSTIDQYKVNGVLPNGTYKGTLSQFSINATSASTTLYGKITTYGDLWPALSKTTYPNCNVEPIKSSPTYPGYPTLSQYGDRIGNSSNILKVGDAATRPSDKIAKGATLTVTIVAADTGYGSSISKTMYNRDSMGATSPILDIFRWDQPDWWDGTSKAPNDLYFNKKYSTTLSFPSTSNSVEY